MESLSKVNISDDLASVHVHIGTITEMKMDVTMKADTKNTFLARIDVYHRGNRIDLAKIDKKWLLPVIHEYDNLLKNLNKTKERESKKETLKHRQIVNIVKQTISIRRTVQSIFRNAHVLNIDTEDGFTQITFIRTRIELDADILTIIRPDLFKNSAVENLFILHSLNVSLANTLIKRRLYNLFSSIKNLINIARIVSTAIWLSISLFSFAVEYIEQIRSDIANNGNITNESLIPLILLILDLIGGPYVLVRFLPKLIGRIILYKIRKELFGRIILRKI
jgi:hypothetical protein